MRVLVLGAGLLGVTTAYYLAKQGHQVTVVDRQACSAAETSFANGGQISVSHAEPWANPSAPLKVLKWLGKEDAPLLFRFRADSLQWLWGLKFLRECSAERTAYNIKKIVNLGTYSRTMLQELRKETGISYNELTKGILHFYTDKAEFDACIEPARQMRELGCDRQVIDADRAVEIEPVLAAVKDKIVGATYTAEDESGDANLFVTELTKLCVKEGVEFLFNRTITKLLGSGRVDGVETICPSGKFEVLTADSYVVALGSFSPMLVRPLGLKLMIYPAKGYSATIRIKDTSLAPSVSLTDDGYKLVYSRLGEKLRVAGTAELNGYDRQLNMVRCQALTKRAMEVFPDALDPDDISYWTGLRPATPSNLPYIGRSFIYNLFLNTGHGTLGWTHACGSGKSLADIISGSKPDVDFAFL